MGWLILLLALMITLLLLVMWLPSLPAFPPCPNHNMVIAEELCEPYQPVYQCRVCGAINIPCNR